MDTVYCGHYGYCGDVELWTLFTVDTMDTVDTVDTLNCGHCLLWTVDTAAAKNGDKWVIKCEQSFSQKERRVGRKKKETTNEASRHFGGGGVSRGTI